MITSNEALKAKLWVLAAVKMQNCYLKKAVSRKSTIESKLRSKLWSVKKEIMTSYAMIRECNDRGKFVIKKRKQSGWSGAV